MVDVVKQSAIFRGTVQGSAFHTHPLAAVLWHEMAHVDSADEREARRREEALWTRLVRDEQVDGTVALGYLRALVSRPDDQLLALAR